MEIPPNDGNEMRLKTWVALGLCRNVAQGPVVISANEWRALREKAHNFANLYNRRQRTVSSSINHY
jgi:hypothetical protein